MHASAYNLENFPIESLSLILAFSLLQHFSNFSFNFSFKFFCSNKFYIYSIQLFFNFRLPQGNPYNIHPSIHPYNIHPGTHLITLDLPILYRQLFHPLENGLIQGEGSACGKNWFGDQMEDSLMITKFYNYHAVNL
jgi:hypothetical protein